MEYYQSDNTHIGRFLGSARFCPESFLVTQNRDTSGGSAPICFTLGISCFARKVAFNHASGKPLKSFFLHLCQNIDVLDISFDFVKKLQFYLFFSYGSKVGLDRLYYYKKGVLKCLGSGNVREEKLPSTLQTSSGWTNN